MCVYVSVCRDYNAMHAYDIEIAVINNNNASYLHGGDNGVIMLNDCICKRTIY